MKKLSFLLVLVLLLSMVYFPQGVEAASEVNVMYRTHVEGIGWQPWLKNGAMAGTQGLSKRVEALNMKLENAPAGMQIRYQSHVQGIGWQDWVYDGVLSGTEGQRKRIEAIKIELVGAPAGYSIEYRAHVQGIGWQSWVKDGAIAGTEGQRKRVEAIEVRLAETGLSGTPAKTYNKPEVEVLPDGREVQYFKDVPGVIYKNIPFIERTKTITGDTFTVGYDIYGTTNDDKFGEGITHESEGKMGHLEITNVVRESEHDVLRLLYAKEPVTISFISNEMGIRDITKYEKYQIDNGKLMSIYPVNVDTSELYYSSVLDDVRYDNQAVTLESGMYAIDFGILLGEYIELYLYVAKEGEDLTLKTQNEGTATPVSTAVNVDNKDYTAPTYNINGESFLRIRDIAYMLNGTSKQFNVVQSKKVVAITWDYEETPEEENRYVEVGGEMKALSAGAKPAKLINKPYYFAGNCGYTCPLIYLVNGQEFVRLVDIAKIMDFELSVNGNTITINTANSYK